MKNMLNKSTHALLAASLLIALPATAATLQWDDNTVTAGLQSMGGTPRQWTTGVPAAGNWTIDSGATHQNWVNANNDTANISYGGDHQMQLQTAITVNAIELNNTNTTGTRRLQVLNNTLTLTSGQVSGNTTGHLERILLGSQVSGNNGLTFTNIDGAWLTNTGNNFTGDIVMNGGTLNHQNQANDTYGAAGNKIRLNNAGLSSNNATATITREIVVTGDVTFRAHSDAGTGLNPLVVNGPITGTGNVTFTNITANNVGSLTLGGSASNTYDGVTRAYANLLQLNKSGGATAVAGNLDIGGGPTGTDVVRYLAGNQIADTSTVFINASGRLEMNNFSDVINSLSVLSGGILDLGSSGVLTVNSLIIDGNTQLAGTYEGGDFTFLTGTGTSQLVVIPEPASLALMGLGGLLMLRRQRQNK